MFEVLLYMFENFKDSPFRTDETMLSKELSAAGFNEQDIGHAFHWFSHLERETSQPSIYEAPKHTSSRIFTSQELKKISFESFDFLLFLVQANILNAAQRELVLDLAMKLPQATISHDEFRWIILMTTWATSQAHEEHAKDYLLVEDVLMNQQKPTLH